MKASSRSWLQTVFRINGKILVLSLVSASSFWLLNALNKRYTTQLSLPLRLEYESEGLVTVHPAPKQLRLNLTGIGWDLIGRSNWLGVSSPLQLPLPKPTVVKNLHKNKLLTAFFEQVRPLRLNYVVEDSLSIDIQRRTSQEYCFAIGQPSAATV